jgi:hypothetical protein
MEACIHSSFTNILSFNPSNNPVMEVLTVKLYRWKNHTQRLIACPRSHSWAWHRQDWSPCPSLIRSQGFSWQDLSWGLWGTALGPTKAMLWDKSFIFFFLHRRAKGRNGDKPWDSTWWWQLGHRGLLRWSSFSPSFQSSTGTLTLGTISIFLHVLTVAKEQLKFACYCLFFFNLIFIF